MRTARPHAELARRTGQFLTKAFKTTGLSRKEAAERAEVTEGYLTGILAGRLASPGHEIVRAMADNWGFNILEFYLNLGYINHTDIEKFVAKNKMMSEGAPDDLQMVHDRLAALPPKRRKEVSKTLMAMLDTLGSGD